jgi:hypothetical protein
MKHSPARTSTSKSSVSEGAIADVGQASGEIGDADVEQMIRSLAYLRAEDRGFFPGREMDDWLAAEEEWRQKSKKR